MEKEGLLSELKSKIGDPNIASKFSNLSERTLTEYVDRIHPTLGENPTIDDTFYSTHLGILESVAGNIRAEASSAVAEYQKNNPIKEVKETKTVEAKGSEDTESAKILKSIAERIEKIETEKLNEAKQSQLNSRISEAKTALKSGGSIDDNVLELAVELVKFTGDESVEDISAKVKAEYDKRYTKLYGDGYSPSGSNSQGHVVPTDRAKDIKAKAVEERKKMNV